MAANVNSTGPVMTSNLQGSTTAQRPLSNAAEIKEVLAAMKGTWSNIGRTYDDLYEQSTKLSDMSPTMYQTVQEINKLHGQIQPRVEDDDNEIKRTKQEVQGEVKGRIMKGIKEELKEMIRSQITLQVSSQITFQIKEHLPVTLESQLCESKAQLDEMKASLKNSEARYHNSALRVNRDLDALLNSVVTANGNISKFFPITLKTLLAFDLKTSQNLAKDYQLHVSQIKEENFNNFMSHIGVKGNLPVFRP